MASGHDERLHRPVTLNSLRQKFCVRVFMRNEQWPCAITCTVRVALRGEQNEPT